MLVYNVPRGSNNGSAATAEARAGVISGAGPAATTADSDLAILISICVSVMTNPEGLSNSPDVVSPSLAD